MELLVPIVIIIVASCLCTMVVIDLRETSATDRVAINKGLVQKIEQNKRIWVKAE